MRLPRIDQHRNVQKILILLCLATMIAIFFSLSMGRFAVSFGNVKSILLSRIVPLAATWESVEETVVIQIRFPRVMLAFLVGGGLSVSGASLQGMFGNPLVSPHILGVSAGAGFGAALGILISERHVVVQGLAMVFGFISVLMTYGLSRIQKRNPIYMLILSGVIIGALFQALISFVTYVADPEEKLPSIVYWLMGSLAGSTYNNLWIGTGLILPAIFFLLLIRWRINVLSLSEEEAKSLGIDVQRLRWMIIVAVTLITSVSVSLSGIIGWIGLVIPHVGRMVVGNDNRYLLPACVLLGGMYLPLIDTFARSATAAEIPLSVLTAIVGAPFFAYLLRKTGGGWA